MRTRTTFLEFKKTFSNFLVFSTIDIQKAFPNMHRRRLHEWLEKGYLKRVIKGYYIFSEARVDENLLYLIANRIYTPSYVSLQSALSWYGLIPEFVPQITSVSTKKTTILGATVGNFSYFSIKKSLMFGYDLIFLNNTTCYVKISYPEKALLDFLYLNPNIDSNAQFVELRLNSDNFKEKIRLDVLKQYLEIFSSKTLFKRVNNLMKYMKNA